MARGTVTQKMSLFLQLYSEVKIKEKDARKSGAQGYW